MFIAVFRLTCFYLAVLVVTGAITVAAVRHTKARRRAGKRPLKVMYRLVAVLVAFPWLVLSEAMRSRIPVLGVVLLTLGLAQVAVILYNLWAARKPLGAPQAPKVREDTLEDTEVTVEDTSARRAARERDDTENLLESIMIEEDALREAAFYHQRIDSMS